MLQVAMSIILPLHDMRTYLLVARMAAQQNGAMGKYGLTVVGFGTRTELLIALKFTTITNL